MAQNQVNITITAKDLASKTLRGVSSSMRSLGDQAMVGGKIMAAASAAGFAVMAKGAISAASSFEQNRIAFETMLGSAEQAKILMQDIATAAKVTPFELDDLVKGGKQLLAFGIEQENIIETMTRLGDIASGVGVPIGQLTNVFGQVKVAGRLMGQDLLQFTNAGVPLIAALAETMKKPQSEIKDLVAAGKVGFPEVETAIKSLTNEGGKFGGLMEKQSKSFEGVVSNIKDSFTLLGLELIGITQTGEVIEGGVFDRLKGAAEGFLNAMSGLPSMIKSWVKSFAPALKIIKSVVKVIADFVKKHQEGFKKIAKSFAIVLPVMIVFAGLWAVITSPIAAFLAVAAAVAVVVALLRVAWEKWGKQIMEVVNVIVGILKPALTSLWDSFMDLFNQLVKLWNYISPVVIPILKALAIIIGVTIVANIYIMINVMKVLVAGIGFVINIARRLSQFMIGTLVGAFNLVKMTVQVFIAAWKLQFTVAVNVVKWMINTVKAVFKGGLNAVIAYVRWSINVIVSVFRWLGNKIVAYVRWSINVAKSIFRGFGSFVHGTVNGVISVFGRIGGAISSGVRAGINTAKGIVRNGVNFIVDKINGMIRGVNNTAGRIPGVPNIPTIPRLARGASSFEGGVALVGERGAELVELPRGSKVNTAQQTEQKMGTNNFYGDIMLGDQGAVTEFFDRLGRNQELSQKGLTTLR